jgi:hypothetical protein
MLERSLEQNVGADHIGGDEVGRFVDRPVDMAFRRQVHDCVGVEVLHELGDRRGGRKCRCG